MRKRLLGAVLAFVLAVSCFTLFAFGAHATTNMKASNACINMIKETEGFFAIPYWDYSQWTVGFGTTCPADKLEEYQQNGIPVEAAEELLLEQLAKFEKSVNDYAKKNGLKLTQNQFDALVSFTYNLGSGTLTKSGSALGSAILSGAKDNELIFAFSIYCMAGGEFMPGLMRRRLAEANMFINGIYDDYAPDSYCYIYYNANGGVRDASAQGYDANMPAVPMSRPARDGYVFVGWYTKPEGGMKVTSLDESTNGMTLYAHWQKSEWEAEDPVDPTEGINVVVVSAAVNVRCGPSTGYGVVSSVHAGDRLTILGTTRSNGMLWGLIDEGWIALVHTNYNEIVAPDTDEENQHPTVQVPAMATVLKDGIVVYNGPHTTYPQLKTLKLGTQIQVLETLMFAGKEWARYADGWIQLDMNLLIHDENTLAHSFSAVITINLAVRKGPGYTYEKLTSLATGSSHTVYAIAMVDGEPWGRVAKGWINLNYTNYDASKLSQYQNHDFGSWYTSLEATCVTPGLERRECKYCDHYEIRETALGSHTYGGWYVVREGDCSNNGLEQRDCKNCGHSQTRNIAGTAHNWGDWTVIQEPTCNAAGKEQRTCKNCGNQESRAISAAGHSFGAWYETQTPTATTAGEERRDCQHCDYYETRTVAPTEHRFGAWYVNAEATCTEVGQERRDCQDCDYHETREIAPLGHSLGVWYESVAPTVDEYGQERRDCQRCDYFETRELEKLPAPTVKRTYATVTCASLRIRSGPGTDYTAVGQLKKGDVVEIFEIKTVGDAGWGRMETGWICLTGLTQLHYEEETHTHSYGDWYVVREATPEQNGLMRRDCACGHYEQKQTDYEGEAVILLYGTLTGYDYLNIRSGPGSSYSLVGKLYRGERVRILEVKTVGSVDWGRTDKGWVCITGYLTLEKVSHCHSYGNWYVSKEATAENVGEERRDCACGHYETREIPKLEVVTKIYGTVTGYDYLNVRSGPGVSYTLLAKLNRGDRVEILEFQMVDSVQWGRIEQGWIRISGYVTLEEVTESHTHSYGDWYVTKNATSEAYGEERRDCACGHYQTREIPKVEPVTKTYATITVSALSIRKGAGTSYTRLGYYYKGDVVEILEQVKVGSNIWGRTEKGWICLTGYTTLKTITE